MHPDKDGQTVIELTWWQFRQLESLVATVSMARNMTERTAGYVKIHPEPCTGRPALVSWTPDRVKFYLGVSK